LEKFLDLKSDEIKNHFETLNLRNVPRIFLLIFEKALSNASWTLPSIGSLFTSLYPHEYRTFYWTDSLPDDCLTLADVFRNKKYKTYAVQTNLCVSKTYNFNQGFSIF